MAGLTPDEVGRAIEEAAPADAPDEAKQTFRELRTDPPAEANAADTTIEALEPTELGGLFYTFDFGDGWEHHLELRETRDTLMTDCPRVVDESGDAPPQYPDITE